mgnify:CR=1
MYSAFPNRKTKATCHPDRPHHAKGFCYKCYRADLRLRNPGIKLANKRRNDTYRERHPDVVKERHRSLRYGLSKDDVIAKLKSQHWQCLVCLKPIDGGRSTHVDHNHKTGRVRGLLCNKCNTGIGMLSENSFILARAIAYLKHYGYQSDLPWEQFIFADLPPRSIKSKVVIDDKGPN